MDSLPQVAPEMDTNNDLLKDNNNDGKKKNSLVPTIPLSNFFLSPNATTVDFLDGQEVGVVKQGNTFSNWIMYHIENQIAAMPNFAFLLIGILFIFCYLLYGFLWYILGMAESNEFNNDDENTVFGTNSLNDALYLSLQMLVAAGYDDTIPSGTGLRSVSFLMIVGVCWMAVWSYRG